MIYEYDFLDNNQLRQLVSLFDAGKFVEEMDNLCKKCFGHTEWRIHTNSDEKLTIVFINKKGNTNAEK